MPSSRDLHHSLRLITLSGCLYMVYNTGVSSPLITKFLENLGATPTQIGLYAGIPMLALSMQFVGALLSRRLTRRKPAFMFCMILGRLLYLPVMLIPPLFPSLRNATGVAWMLAFLFGGNVLNHMASPLWYSWMGDLIPRRMLNRYWGVRQTWSSATWVLSYLLIMSLSWSDQFALMPLVVTVGCFSVLAGVVDIALFAKVHEPAFPRQPPAHPIRILFEPLLDARYRKLVAFFGSWSAISSCAAALMGFYLFVGLHMTVWEATLLWCVQGVGTALSARGWGKVAQRRGCVFLVRICFIFKSLIAAAFLLVTPANAFPILLPILFFDGMWNAGFGVAHNGLMFQASPENHRPMFVAAMIGFCGLFGGLSAILGGRYVSFAGGGLVAPGFLHLNGYQMVFLFSLVMRVLMAFWAWRIAPDKPKRSDPWIADLMLVWPFRALRYPVGLYSGWKREK
ncbi:MAG: MFS transporter [Kiritimatiellae bacterium]|nr:MFS transporter [Kiritimatiellia bacterium]